MQRSIRRITALSALAALALLSGCSKVHEGRAEGEKAARVEKSGDVSRVVLIEQAAKRLGIETGPVAQLDAGHETVPYSAIIYDAEGHSWVFTTSGPLSYAKAPITIDHIDGDRAVLTAGPPAGTQVVTQGAEELFGVEDGIGEFE